MPTTFYSRNYIDWPPVPVLAYCNPNSEYWREQAETAVADFDRLAPDFLTQAEWEQFNRLYLSYYGDLVTWKQAYQCYKTALEALGPAITLEYLAYVCGILPEGAETASGAWVETA